ncbi:MAG: hypothetical protein MK025_03430 [Acidobacteriia bacterium]|nr:hypothetical protein [Terriglobia bacterium]
MQSEKGGGTSPKAVKLDGCRKSTTALFPADNEGKTSPSKVVVYGSLGESGPIQTSAY